MLDFAALAHQCAPEVDENTISHVVSVESSYNPYAIGIVGAHLLRQPQNLPEAVATGKWLISHGLNFSVGLGQVNKANFSKYGLTVETAFDPCKNLRASSAILKDCYLRAYQTHPDEQRALRDSFSCYYSGNFVTGYTTGYVIRVVTGNAGTGRVARRENAGGSNGTPVSNETGSPSALVF
jgi:type IV secretion system protein VirB1